jgi:demethylmenaquinone methyltransferase/2-methoxy-6-polyprenyl-1,4-benzoquinol methylase
LSERDVTTALRDPGSTVAAAATGGNAGAAGSDSDSAMRDYYARRAADYEAVYAKPERQADLRAIETLLPDYFAGHDVLEVACGTGWWTPHGARDCRSWLATDVNDETLAIARTKPLPPGKVSFAQVDAWTFAGLADATVTATPTGQPAARFNAAFAGFWWSHVPLARLPSWLKLLHQQLASGARVVMIDNRYVAASSTPISRSDADGNSWQQRLLSDGSQHEVLKNFPTAQSAFKAIAAADDRARDPQWTEFEHYWLLSYHLS